ncbi:6505_t:CDS:1, partial [Entrophospora sp. SA101]
MAIIDLEDDKKNETIPFKKISKMFKKNIMKFNEIKLNDGEKMLDAIKGIEKIEDAIDFVTNFSSMSNL